MAFPSDGAAAVGLLAAAGVLGIIGAAIGALVRHPVPAIVGALLWLFVVENLVSLVAGAAAAYLPGKLATILAGVQQDAVAPPGTVAATAMAGYAAVLTVAGMLVIRRRDAL